jgi:hypothetical protein
MESDRGLRIAEALRQGGLNPPSPSAIVTDPQSKRAVDRLLLAGRVVRAVDRAKGREILFHQDAINDAQRLLAPLLDRPPGLLVTEVGEALGISRKYSMPLLAYLDAIRFTVRVADRRVRATPLNGRVGNTPALEPVRVVLAPQPGENTPHTAGTPDTPAPVRTRAISAPRRSGSP